MPFQIVDQILAAQVINGAGVNVAYPAGTDAGTFKGAVGHSLSYSAAPVGSQAPVLLTAPADFTLTFNAANITVTNGTGSAWPAASRLYLQLEQVGAGDLSALKRTISAAMAYVNLGAPVAASAAGIAAAQLPAAAGNLALAANVLDVPRALTITGVLGTTAANFTITGTDEYGARMVETIAGPVGAATVAGKKAFKNITSIAVSAGTTANVSVGWGDVLGLPLFLQDSDFVLKEIQDDAVAAAGTFVNGDLTKPTAATGDVRGTYDPIAACDGLKTFRLVVGVPDPAYRGLTQFAG